MEYSLPSENERALVGPPDLWEMKSRFQFTFLCKLGLKPVQNLLDFGCGNLRGGIPLITYLDEGNYTGTDIRGEIIELAKKQVQTHFLKEKFPNLLGFPDEFQQLEYQKFDYIWSFSVLYHISDMDLQPVLCTLKKYSGAGTQFLANVQIGPNQVSSWREFPFVQREWSWYEEEFLKSGWCIKDLGPMMEFGHFHPRLSMEEQQKQRMILAIPIM